MDALQQARALVNEGLLTNDEFLYLISVDNTDYETTQIKSDKIEQMIRKRNILLLKFFYAFQHDLFSTNNATFRLIGSPNQPKVILNNDMTFSIFVKNFNLYFSTQFGDGDIVRSFNLGNIESIQSRTVRKIADQYATKPVYKLLDRDSGLYFSHLNNWGHAMYTRTDPRLYTVKDTAEAYANMLKAKHAINVSVV